VSEAHSWADGPGCLPSLGFAGVLGLAAGIPGAAQVPAAFPADLFSGALRVRIFYAELSKGSILALK